MMLEARGLVKRYGDIAAVDGVDICVDSGEVLGLLGPNGAGKTTAIHCMMGLTVPDSGEVTLDGDKRRIPAEKAKHLIGLVPQDIAVFEDLTAQENVTFFARLYGLKGKVLADGVAYALECTGLSDKGKQKPKTFSGGMKRRLNIACALAHRPKLLIMDEPTVGIDPQSRNHILESVRMLHREHTAVLYTSHYMEEIEAVCTRVMIMDHGRMIASGTQSDLKALAGDEEVISIELEHAAAGIEEALQRIAGVRSCRAEGTHLQITAERNTVRLNRIIETINAEIVSVEVEKPSLESVFLTLTGRSLRD